MHNARRYSCVATPTPATGPVAAPSIAMSPGAPSTPDLVAPLAPVKGSMAAPALTTNSAADSTPVTCPAVSQTFLTDPAVTLTLLMSHAGAMTLTTSPVVTPIPVVNSIRAPLILSLISCL